ncbi:glycosyltransferase family 2 protein [bacterium]|nr:glycosyltransferase family 2 protein [bacterium]
MNNPTVSVLTPIYNTRPEYLRECIESVLGQTFTDFEFIILNDSPNNIQLDRIVAEYNDPRIRYYKNDRNMGISASRNRLVELARGRYLAIFDHDDVCMPERLAAQVDFLDKNPDIGVVSALMQVFTNSGPKCILHAPEYDTDIKVMLTRDCCIAHSAAMIRRTLFTDNHIEYDAYCSPAEDYRLWARLMGITHFHNIQCVLVRYRDYPEQTSVRVRCQMRRCHDAIALDIQNRYPAYWREMRRSDNANITVFRLRLFGRIPLLKIKNNRIYLFECIPVFKVKWR